jgi:hypothetical protein
MRQVLIAVLLSAAVWPGAGQIYNREFRKAAVLISLTLLSAISLFSVAGVAIARRLPPNMDHVDVGVASVISQDVARENAGLFLSFNLLILAIWLYSVVDAYFGARERLKAPPAPAPEPEEPVE